MQQHTWPRVYLTCFTTTMLTLVSKLSIIFTFTSFQQFIVLIFHFTGLRNVCGRLFLFHTTAKPFVKQVKDFMIQKHEKKNRMKREREKKTPPYFTCQRIYYCKTWMDSVCLKSLTSRCKWMTFKPKCIADMDTLDTNNNWFYAFRILEKVAILTSFCPLHLPFDYYFSERSKSKADTQGE